MTEIKNLERREKLAARARWSYVILAVVMVMMFVLLGGFTIKYVNDNNRAWCELIHASLPTKAPVLSTNPTAEQVKRYNDYQIVVRLGEHLGCI